MFKTRAAYALLQRCSSQPNVLDRSSPATRRGPGRPKKHEEVDTPAPRRRGRSSKKALELTNGEDEDDTSYEPTESEQMGEGDEDTEEDWEMGALVWGLLSVIGRADQCMHLQAE